MCGFMTTENPLHIHNTEPEDKFKVDNIFNTLYQLVSSNLIGPAKFKIRIYELIEELQDKDIGGYPV